MISPATAGCIVKALRSCCSPRTKPTPAGCLESRTARPYVKDGINDYIVHGATEAVNPEHTGTKAAAHYQLTVGAGETVVVRLRLADSDFKGKRRLCRLRQDLRAPPARSRRVLCHCHSARPFGGCTERHAPGLCRHVVVEAVLSLRDQRLAAKAIPAILPRPRSAARAAITSGLTCTTPT